MLTSISSVTDIILKTKQGCNRLSLLGIIFGNPEFIDRSMSISKGTHSMLFVNEGWCREAELVEVPVSRI